VALQWCHGSVTVMSQRSSNMDKKAVAAHTSSRGTHQQYLKLMPEDRAGTGFPGFPQQRCVYEPRRLLLGCHGEVLECLRGYAESLPEVALANESGTALPHLSWCERVSVDGSNSSGPGVRELRLCDG
jgi:hypothetical protein